MLEFRIYAADGSFIAQVDLAWPSWRLALELDSVQFHLTRRAFERDPRARNRLVAAGWNVQVCTWEMWMHDRATLRNNLAASLS